MLSDYCKKIVDEYKIKVGDVKKLIPSLGTKTHITHKILFNDYAAIHENELVLMLKKPIYIRLTIL